jgi:hypothetical protein
MTVIDRQSQGHKDGFPEIFNCPFGFNAWGGRVVACPKFPF